MRMRLVSRVIPMPMAVRMGMMIAAAAKQPGGGDVHGETTSRDEDRFVEMDRHRREETCGCLIANDQGDHRKDDGARVSGKIAKLSSAEDEARIMRVPPRISISKGRDQERQRMSCHMKPV